MTYIHQFNHYIIINTLLWSLLYYKFRPVLCLLLWCWRHSWRALAKFLPRPRPPPTAYHLPPPCPTTPLSVAVGGSGCGQIKSEMNVHPCDIVCFTLAAHHRFYPPSLSVCCPFLLTNTTRRKEGKQQQRQPVDVLYFLLMLPISHPLSFRIHLARLYSHFISFPRAFFCHIWRKTTVHTYKILDMEL